MAYRDHFVHADDVVDCLRTYVPTVGDPLKRMKFVGFVAVASVTVYEQAVKSIFIEFGEAKNKVFGRYVRSHFDRINGRIGYQVIKDDYVRQFGDKYYKRFKHRIKERSGLYLKSHKRDIVNSYGNIITWRNDFAHEGKISSMATLEETIEAYEDGKEVIRCLAETMQR